MYIKDNVMGMVRLYGTNHHDSLMISDDGKYLSYYNLQCGEGSEYGSYSFVTDENGTLPKDDEVLLEHGAEAYFNIGGWRDVDAVLDKIRDEIEREADYQDAYVDADVAKGMYMALEMIDKHTK